MDNIPAKVIEAVAQFQCPGCALGNHPDDCVACDIRQDTVYGAQCRKHSAGTMLVPGGMIYLGLPKGFNKVGYTGKPNAIGESPVLTYSHG